MTTSDGSESSKIDPASVDPTTLTAEQLEQTIHALVAQRLVEGLRQVVFQTAEGGEVLNPLAYNPQFLAQCIRFLNDNNVKGLDMPGSVVDQVREAYKNKAPFKLTGT